jgi:hypothetical protein
MKWDKSSLMDQKKILIPTGICWGLILINFLAQIPYFFHLYYRTQAFSADVRSFLILGLVFGFFLIGSVLLVKRQRVGYWWMVVFLSTEFLFYLNGAVSSAAHGDGLFFQVHNPDLLLRIIYSIGYLNLFASAGFLILLFHDREFFRNGSVRRRDLQ